MKREILQQAWEALEKMLGKPKFKELESLEEMNKFRDASDLYNLHWVDMNNLNRSVMSKNIEIITFLQ